MTFSAVNSGFIWISQSGDFRSLLPFLGKWLSHELLRKSFCAFLLEKNKSQPLCKTTVENTPSASAWRVFKRVGYPFLEPQVPCLWVQEILNICIVCSHDLMRRKKKKPTKGQQILSPIPVLRLIFSSAFLLSLRIELMRRHSWSQPKGWDREETHACATPACTPVRNLMMFPISVTSLWDFGGWGSHSVPDQRAEPEVQAGVADGRALARLGPVPWLPPAPLPSCSLHLHSSPWGLLITQAAPHKPAWRPQVWKQSHPGRFREWCLFDWQLLPLYGKPAHVRTIKQEQ